MKNNNIIKWGAGAIVALSLTGCHMDMDQTSPSYERSNYQTQTKSSTNQAVTTDVKPAQKTYSTKDPVQKSVPGPKRDAAPALPVIQ